MTCKSIMYHYVRPTDDEQPHLFYLNLEDFERQLDYFEQHFGFVSQAQWFGALENSQQIPDGVILTFDDGLIDHYRYVYPLLKARGLWGVFYVSSATLQAAQLLSVHRVHYLLGRFGGTKVMDALEALVDESMFIEGFYDQLKAVPYAMQSMDEHSLRVKKMVNYAFRPELKDQVLGKLFQELVGDEAAIAKDFYMSREQIQEMSRDGFLFGAHGESHNLLTKFTSKVLTREVAGSVQAVNAVLDIPSNTFCYPYGGPDSWNDQVLGELDANCIQFGFCVEPQDITYRDLEQRRLCLPRYDCNQFPHGKARLAL